MCECGEEGEREEVEEGDTHCVLFCEVSVSSLSLTAALSSPSAALPAPHALYQKVCLAQLWD